MIFSTRKSDIIEKAGKDNFASVQFLSVDAHGKIDKVDVPCNRLKSYLFNGERFKGSSIEGFARAYKRYMCVYLLN